MSDKNEKVRLDLWLKHVCLYKHRNEATTDCNGGKIKLNGGRAKAAASIKEGDVVEFRRGDWDRKFVITGLPAKQVAKERAEEFYRDESGPRPEKQTPFERAMARRFATEARGVRPSATAAIWNAKVSGATRAAVTTMKSDEEYERDRLWVKSRTLALSEPSSPVSISNEKGEELELGVLNFAEGELRLEDVNAIRFCVPLRKVENVAFRRRAIHIYLDFEVAQRLYHLAILNVESEDKVDDYQIGGWFGNTWPGLLIPLVGFMVHRKSLMQANFAEAEKWRAVFPAAPFSDTQIKNA